MSSGWVSHFVPFATDGQEAPASRRGLVWRALPDEEGSARFCAVLSEKSRGESARDLGAYVVNSGCEKAGGRVPECGLQSIPPASDQRVGG